MKTVDLMPPHSGIWTNFLHLAFDQAAGWVIQRTNIEMNRAGREESEKEKVAEACSKALF